MSEVTLYVPPPFDLAISEEDRVEMWRDLCAHSAEMQIAREEHEDSPWMPQATDTEADLEKKGKLRRQEVDRREMQIITSTTRIGHIATMRWVLDHGDDAWVGSDGESVSFREELESLMPNTERRASSGRARDIAAFRTRSTPVFRNHGIPDDEIAAAYAQGFPTYLGVVAAAQKIVSDNDSEHNSRKEKFTKMLDIASVAQSAYALKRALTKIAVGQDENAIGDDEIPYTIENDGEQAWVIMHMDRDLFVYRVLDKLREILVPSLESLAERFSQFWKAQQG